MKLLVTSAASAALVLSALSGCSNMSQTQQDTGKGAAIGAVAGAVLGAATGDSTRAGQGAVLGAAVGAGAGYIWSQRMQEQKRAMEQATQGTGVGVTQTADNRLKLDIPSDISFAVGRSAITPNFTPVLDKFADSLRQHPVTTLTIVGHTDSTGSDAVNNPLSLERAASTRDYLVGRGVAVNRVAIEGRGEREPIADNSTVQGRAANRRVEIYVAEAPPRPVTNK
jgi:outer membrane protein OmpA-like peptidoglycan-associated protein